MKYDDKISVIVPIYNVEKYLEKCIQSILIQNYRNLEVILVNDGSKDKCLEICKKFEAEDKRIIIIDKRNGGLSEARNYGIDKATGKYITFVDSDDYLDEDYISFLYTNLIINECDISICNPRMIYEDLCEKKDIYRYKKTINKVKNAKDALEIMLYQKKFDNSAWGKLYKIELFDGIRYPVGKLYEDIATTYKTFLKAKKVFYSNACKYNYLQRKESIMGRRFKIQDIDYIKNAEEMMIDLKNDKILYKAAKSRFISANFSILRKINNKKDFLNETNWIKENIKKYRLDVLFNYKSRFKNKIAILLSFLNFDLCLK